MCLEGSRGRRFVRHWSVANDNAVQQTTMMKWLQRQQQQQQLGDEEAFDSDVKWTARRAIDQLQRGVWVNYMYFSSKSRRPLRAAPPSCGHNYQLGAPFTWSRADTRRRACFMRTLWRNQQTAEIGRGACTRLCGFKILVSLQSRWHRFLLVRFTAFTWSPNAVHTLRQYWSTAENS